MTTPQKQAANAAWQCANPDKHRASNARWRAANPKHNVAWRAANPDKHRASNTRWRDKNPDKNRIAATTYARRIRGIPEPTRAQPALCEIKDCCRKAVHVDHDHLTGAFRGWLCVSHNLGIGAIGDTLAAAQNVVDYLRQSHPLLVCGSDPRPPTTVAATAEDFEATQ